jgi:hypothetical protein
MRRRASRLLGRARQFLPVVVLGGLLGALAVTDSRSEAAPKAPPVKRKPPTPPAKPVAPPPPRSALLTKEAWQNAPLTPVKPGEIDALVGKELAATKVEPAPLTTDEQFIRRVTLDLTGQLPLPADVEEFIADKDSRKRAKLINTLLDSDEYARHWARYWRDVIASRLTDRRGMLLARAFEGWMFEQLKKDRGWGDIVREMLTAEGAGRFDEPDKNGAAFFLLSRQGADAVNERAAETSRIFLGIQLQCAQCHDHPFDQWKRVQFHELAGYFARVRERPVRDGMRLVGFELVSTRFGEHQMPSKEDPKKSLVTNPRFLDGKSPGPGKSDQERRKALADAITDKGNYWFAGAFVNRLWGELMGQSFYQPVDDMGPQKEAVFPAVLTRLTGAFRGSDYDIKALFRAVLNSETYQRQIRLGESSEHLHFAAAYPTRLRADALWESLVGVLGPLGPGGPNRPLGPLAGPYGFRGGMEGLFKQEFSFDPSSKPDDVEGSIPQALLLMNSPVVNQRIRAEGTNLLGRILKAYPQDDDALRMVYLRTLARKPTDRELEKCHTYIKGAGSRAEAFEDILWALLNSTEFQTKR